MSEITIQVSCYCNRQASAIAKGLKGIGLDPDFDDERQAGTIDYPDELDLLLNPDQGPQVFIWVDTPASYLEKVQEMAKANAATLSFTLCGQTIVRDLTPMVISTPIKVPDGSDEI